MRIDWQKWAAIAICALTVGAGLIFFGGKLLAIALPFLLAFGISLCVTPLSDRLSKYLHLPARLCAVVLFTLLLIGLLLLLGATANRLLRELRELLERLLKSEGFPNAFLSDSFDYFERLTAGSILLDRPESAARYAAFRNRFNQTVSDMIENALASVSAELPRIAAKWIAALPTALLFAAVTVIAGFYFCMDRQWGQRVAAMLPRAIGDRIPRWKAAAKRISWKYVKAYLVLLLLTFAQLFLGFTILQIEYAFLLAFLISVIDILPVLGVGTVLVPWAIIALAQKDLKLGFGLLVIYFVVTVIRQITEPRLIGKSLGLHPLSALLASYAGWTLFGVFGMALGPLAALFFKSLYGPYAARHRKDTSGTEM